MRRARDRASRYWRRNQQLVAVLLIIWFISTFVVSWYARELSSPDFFGWPFSYWVGAQGALLVYLFIVVVYAYLMSRADRRLAAQDKSTRAFDADGSASAEGIDDEMLPPGARR